MNIDSVGKEKCTGCMSCLDACHVDGIDVKRGTSGHMFAISNENCVECGKCAQVCPILNSVRLVDFEKKYFAAVTKENNIGNSSSGGTFFHLANMIIKDNGFVYGAALNHDNQLYHIYVDKIDEIPKLQGSKYLQSNMRGIYSHIQSQLKEDRTVLFVGTPCQVHALNNFIPEKYKTRLITVDLLCRGVPSQELFDSYIQWIIQKIGNFGNYNFRNRNYSGKVTIEIKDKIVVGGKYVNMFNRLYSLGYLMRESCYNCKYCSYNRCGDITIGDFWGINRISSKWKDEAGVSLLIVNTHKGETVWEKIRDKMDYLCVEKEQCYQQSLGEPCKKPKDYDSFWKLYKRKGFAWVAYLYGRYSVASKLLTKAKKVIWRFSKEK